MEIIAKNEGDYDILNDKIIQDGLGLKDEFKNALLVRNGELVYDVKSDIKLQQLFESVGVKCREYPIPAGGSLHTDKNSDGKIINVAPIPEGFVVSSIGTENTIAQGLVIKQIGVTPNEFVWVPVPNPETDYKRGVKGRESDINSYIENDSVANKAIKDSVFKYNGFYIGRYETGLNVDAEYAGSDVGGTYWRDATPVVIRNAKPWNYISQTKAKEVSKNIVNTASVNSTLINSYMWDTTLNYIISSGAKSGPDVISNSKLWGNYADAEFTPDSGLYSTDWHNYPNSNTAKPAGTWRLLTTGATTKRNAPKNIHDLAGNLYEWTTENVNGGSGSASIRGGVCSFNGNGYAAYRYNGSVANINYNFGFRVGLYLL